MYSYQNANNFNCSNPNMNSYYSRMDIENWNNQVHFSSYQISHDTPLVHETLIAQDEEQTNTSQYSPSYQNHPQLLSCNISEPVEATSYNNVRIASYPNYPYQCSPDYPEPVLKPYLHIPKPCNNHNIMAKKHRAQISLVSSSTGTFKAIVKRKRKRTVFTTEQVAALEKIFAVKPYVTREDRQVLVQTLQINDKAIKIWFQNRRLKGKRAPEEDAETFERIESIIERCTPDASRLDFVQSQIIEKTDEFGFVTLDDRVMADLADVIDNFLTQDSGLKMSNKEMTDDESSSPIYEPISPASVFDGSHEDYPTWKPTEPNESLQRLFDLQTMLTL